MRPTRTISPTGMYHIVVHSLNDLKLFREKQDYEFLLSQLTEVTTSFSVYAYCLLPNEFQLFLRENNAGEVPGIMRRLLTRYAVWYNRKYHRKGSITEGRYQCAPVLNGDEANLVRYIHQAPVRAGLCQEAFQYLYSSILGEPNGFITIRRDWFSDGFEAFHKQAEQRDFTIRPSGKLTDSQVKERVTLFCRQQHISDWKLLPKQERDAYLSQLREQFSIGQLESATGLSRGIIARCRKIKEQPSMNRRQMESFLL